MVWDNLSQKLRNAKRKTLRVPGRHRILVQKTSRLRSYLEGLKNEGRLIKLAETVALSRTMKQDSHQQL